MTHLHEQVVKSRKNFQLDTNKHFTCQRTQHKLNAFYTVGESKIRFLIISKYFVGVVDKISGWNKTVTLGVRVENFVLVASFYWVDQKWWKFFKDLFPKTFFFIKFKGFFPTF